MSIEEIKEMMGDVANKLLREAAKAAAKDMRLCWEEGYEEMLISVFPMYIASGENPTSFLTSIIRGFGPTANQSLKALVLAFYWEMMWIEEKREELPSFAKVFDIYEETKQKTKKGQWMTHAAFTKSGFAFRLTEVEDGDD